MATPGLAHLLLFIGGLHKFIPGLIHSFKEDAGAQSIAGFTNYEKAKPEILWAFRIIGNGITLICIAKLSQAQAQPEASSAML